MPSRFIRLSHNISAGAPGWPGHPRYTFEQFLAIRSGDVVNVGVLHLCNHFGTHVDGPRHFNPGGTEFTDLDIGEFIFERPLVIDVDLDPEELVTPRHLTAPSPDQNDPDIILLRSGWSTVRLSDPKRYELRGPAVSAQTCEFLISEYPGLRALGLDWMSLATPTKIEEGIAAHRALCGRLPRDRYVLILEDLDLSRLPPDTVRLYAFPLYAEGADSSPCTVVAERGAASLSPR